MAGEWRETTIGEFAPFSYGKGLPEHRRDSFGDVPVFGSNGIVGLHNEAIIPGPAVVIGRKGTVGAVHYSAKLCWPIDMTFYVVDDDPHVLRFKYYLLKSLVLEYMNADSAVPGLNRDAAHARKVLIPPLPEQRAIAHILGTLDDKIELNRRMSEKLEEMARVLFKSWFVDFDPVRAKMEGRWRKGESLPGLPNHLYDLFPDCLVDSELGEIPEGWEVKPIGGVVKVVGGSTPSTEVPAYWGGEYYWTTPKDLSSLSTPVLLGTERKITKPGLATISSGLLPVDTLLMSSRAPVGYLAVTKVPIAVNQGYIAIPPHDRLSSLFLLYWCEANMERIKERAGGTTFQEISKMNFRPIPIVLPAEEVLAWFNVTVGPMFERIVSNERESQTLAAIRDALLPKLISGELRVPNAERIAGRCV